MKTTVTLFLILISLVSCQATETSIEDELYQCLVQLYEEKNVDLPSSLDSLEDHLVQAGILTSHDGQGKVAYYEEIIRRGEVHQISETANMKHLRRSFVSTDQTVKCLKSSPSFDSLTYYSSHFHLTSQKVNESVAEVGALTPDLVSKAIVEHLNANDFEHPFYRAQVLLSFVMTNDHENSFVRTVPKPITPKTNSTDGFIIDISIPDTFAVNNEVVPKEVIDPALVEYLTSFDSSGTVRIKLNT